VEIKLSLISIYLFKAEKWEGKAVREFLRDERTIKLHFLSEASRVLWT